MVKYLKYKWISLFLFIPFFVNAQRSSVSGPSVLTYPTTKRENIKDIYFGTTVNDPYQWLENDHSEDTKTWIKTQNEFTRKYFTRITCRDEIKAQLTNLMNYEKRSGYQKKGGYTYYSSNTGLQSQSVIYRKKDGEEPEIFLDPNTFSKDGTVSIVSLDFSTDGNLLAYSLSESGSDWTKIVVIKTKDKSIVGDTLLNIKFSNISWLGDKGFFYSGYDDPKELRLLSASTRYQKLFFHKIGNLQKDDSLIVDGKNGCKRYTRASITKDEHYLIITSSYETPGSDVFIKDLKKTQSALIHVDLKFFHSEIIGNIDSKLYIYTIWRAKNGRIMTVDASNPEVKNWTELIPETDYEIKATMGGGKLFVNYTKEASSSVVLQYDTDGHFEHAVKLPGLGIANGFSGVPQSKELTYSFTSCTYPSTTFKYAILTGKSTLYQKSKVKINPDNYESKQVFYKSKDGTQIPMTLTYKKGLVLDGKNPTLLYGYGGFGKSMLPSFDITNLILLDHGGIYAVANLRGGGEYGVKWHLAGMKMNKQNVFDDFIAAGEYLIAQHYTSQSYLACKGGSNGGLLVGAVIAQRPDLFRVAFPQVGAMDMLRYQKFTAGASWVKEYGSSADSKEMFNYLYKYSPLHALKPGLNYPATLVGTCAFP
jgi:prolyl oligopeptidase